MTLSVRTSPDWKLYAALPPNARVALELTGFELVWLVTHVGAEPFEGGPSPSDLIYEKASKALEALLEGASE